MKLLIVTQVMDKNHPILGFFHRWVEEFAKHFEEVHVICLEKGVCDLPEHVHVYSLGKEKKHVLSLIYLWRLNMLSWRLRRKYDAVFVHMNPEYVIAGGLLWQFLGRITTLWYAHGAVSFRLRMAVCVSKLIFTSTELGFRLKTNKKRVVGQGIDLETFSLNEPREEKGTLRLVTVGRITAAKRLETLIAACELLKASSTDFILTIVGLPQNESDKLYKNDLIKFISEKKLDTYVVWQGSVSQEFLPEILYQQDVFISDGATGSLDKALIEAAACGISVVSSNESFAALAPKELVFTPQNATMLSEILVKGLWKESALKSHLRRKIVEENSIEQLINKIKIEIES